MTRLRPGVAAMALVAALVVVPAGPAAGEATVFTNRGTAAPGDLLQVRGIEWPGPILARVEVCWNAALNGTSDCDPNTARDVGIEADGTFSTVIQVPKPRGFCPCVVRVSGPATTTVVTVPLEVSGTLTAEPHQDPVPEITRLVEVASAKVTGTGPWTSWFGAAPLRTLELTVRNVGDVAVAGSAMSVVWGKGDDPTHLVEAPDLERLEPGEVRTIEIPVRLDAGSMGGYVVAGEIDGFGEPVTFRATTSVYPWAWLVAALVLVQLTLLWIRNRVRRMWWKAEEEAEVETPEAEPVPVAEPVPALEPALVGPPEDESVRRPVPVDVDAVAAALAGAFTAALRAPQPSAGPALQLRPPPSTPVATPLQLPLVPPPRPPRPAPSTVGAAPPEAITEPPVEAATYPTPAHDYSGRASIRPAPRPRLVDLAAEERRNVVDLTAIERPAVLDLVAEEEADDVDTRPHPRSAWSPAADDILPTRKRLRAV